MNVDTTVTPIVNSPPDWASIQNEICCPLCNYNLRGLINPRCPECGYAFAWPEVLDPRRQRHPFLFEHHPESRFTSFWRTLWATGRPSAFWTTVHPAQRVYPRRLLLYWVLVSIPFVGNLFLGSLALNRLNLLVAIEDMLDGDLAGFWFLWIWPWLVFASLLVFRWSMRRAKVGTQHVLRCVLYAHDLIFWTSAVPGVLCLFYTVMMVTDICPYDQDNVGLLMVASGSATCLGHVLAFYRLHRAYRLYMRFDLVGAMLLAVFVISVLLLANLAVFMN